ncbi:MAG: hypothetical protein K6E77_08655 [Lachnospiraceae bacterium]|nr:hypothetical protein [Lachnospiraceae bacterium]
MSRQDIEKKNSPIKTVYLSYTVLLIVLVFLLVLHARKSLIQYEASQPERIMEQITASLHASGLKTEIAAADTDYMEEVIKGFSIPVEKSISCNEYETDSEYISNLNSALTAENADIKYTMTGEDYSDGSFTYAFSVNGKHFADAKLIPGDSYSRLIFLKITEWKPVNLYVERNDDRHSVTVSMPRGMTAYINGKEISKDHITASVSMPELDYCREYTEIPEIVTMEVPGFMDTPSVSICNASGEIINCEASDDGNGNLSFETGYETPAMPEDLKEKVLDMAHTYSLFFTRDLPGAVASIDPIRPLFPEDSEYLKLAETYRRQDMEIIVAHTGTAFISDSVSEYTVYSKDCFSCRISFTKTMNMYGQEIKDDTDNTYYFVRIDNKWKIADIE